MTADDGECPSGCSNGSCQHALTGVSTFSLAPINFVPGRKALGALSGWSLIFLSVLILASTCLSSCTIHSVGNLDLKRNVYVELVDWHISGLWIFNTPICWIRVVNYNNVPVKDVRVRFRTFGYNGQPVSDGTYTMEGTVGARSVKNFMEQTVGVVNLESDMLSIELDAVEGD